MCSGPSKWLVQTAACVQHGECAGFHVPAPHGQSVLMLRRRSRTEIGADGPALGLMETQWGEKARL